MSERSARNLEVDFEDRLESMHKSPSCAVYETDAAVDIYERLVTAKAICSSVLGAKSTSADIVAVLSALTEQAHFLRMRDSELLGEGAERLA